MILSFIMIYILVIVYAITQGKAHAILYSKLGAEAFPGNEHQIFVLERLTVLAIITFSTLIKTEDSLILIVSGLIGFSFWHNGSYYLTKGKIFKQYIGWFGQSKTSTATLEIHPTLRTIGFIISLVISIIWLLVRDEIIKPV